MHLLKKIVVIGPESTGKSTLCEWLAQQFHTEWVPEFARQYLLANGTDYSYSDLLTIAKGQLAGEKEISLKLASGTALVEDPLPLFIDTDQYVMKVWCEFVFGNCHQWIINQIASNSYDLYLLCNTDLPWVADELREYPDEASRKKLFHIYKDIMINQSTPWVEIKGKPEERQETARAAVRNLLKK